MQKRAGSRIDAVLEEVQSLKQREPNFKAVIITESDGAGEYIKKRLGDKVGTSTLKSVLWMVAWGDAGTQAAAKGLLLDCVVAGGLAAGQLPLAVGSVDVYAPVEESGGSGASSRPEVAGVQQLSGAAALSGHTSLPLSCSLAFPHSFSHCLSLGERSRTVGALTCMP